jgi:DNA mismatch repair protein MutS2
VITALSGDEAEVQAGALRLRVKVSELRRKPEDLETSKEKQVMIEAGNSSTRHSLLLTPSPGLELDLRGQKAEDALSMLEDYLDRAFLAGMPFVRIIHGKGTGKLRQEVRAALKGHPHVRSFEEGGEKEGGAGVTVAILVAG